MRKILNAITNGLMELRYHGMRSLLSLLGIILGVINLSVLFSVLNGVKVANEELIASIGSQDLIQVSLDWDKMRFATDTSQFYLSWSDVESLRNNGSTIKAVGVEVYSDETIQYGDNTEEYPITAITRYNFDMNGRVVEKGRIFSEYDEEIGARVCVIGADIQDDIFNGEDALGETFLIGGQLFLVIGVMEYYGEENASGENPMEWKNEEILIPATTYQARFESISGNWFFIYVQSLSPDMVSATMKEIKDIFMRNHNDEDIISIESLQNYSQEMDEMVGVWSTVMGIVAAISLLVGGVGIMNVMLATFRERIREIGIRKAVGANNNDIFLLFIVESVVICIVGGIIGLALGYGISMGAMNQVIADLLSSEPQFSWNAGFGSVLFSVVIGFLAGIYPAIKASKLAPVEALTF